MFLVKGYTQNTTSIYTTTNSLPWIVYKQGRVLMFLVKGYTQNTTSIYTVTMDSVQTGVSIDVPGERLYSKQNKYIHSYHV